jgi:solute carrier family 35 protein F5
MKTPTGSMISREYALGFLFIILVAVIWTASSILVQYLYNDHAFHSPFLVAYIGVSLFTLWLPNEQLVKWVKRQNYENVLNIFGRTVLDDGADHAVNIAVDQLLLPGVKLAWTDKQHWCAALYIAPVCFVANLTYNASLAYTSITSSTVLASTGSLFTFLFALLAKDEHFTFMKLLGVVLGVCGCFMTTLQDTHSSSSGEADVYDADEGDTSTYKNPLLGDILGLMSAIAYGAYAVQIRVVCPHDESLYSMQRLLGYVGLINMVALSPIALGELFVRVRLSPVVVGLLILKGLFDNVLSDYLWLRAVLLINATVATVGLGIAIPLAFAADLVLGKEDVLSSGAVLGALAILAGFVLVNIANNPEHHAPVLLHPVEESEDSDDQEEGVILQYQQID